MGEWAKKIGEIGESIVSELFEEIGWGDAQTNLSIDCVHGHRHGTNQKAKTTHGIDAFFSYPSRLTDRTLDHIVISVKYSSNSYPDTPNSKFKEHFYDLSKTMECFKKSPVRNKAGKQFAGVETARNVGVLFWLTNDKNNVDVISKVTGCRKLDEFAYDTIFIVDDKRAAFLYDSIRFVRRKFFGDKVEFMHPDTGKNINPTTKGIGGDVLPVEYINSPILPFRVTSQDNIKTLILACMDELTVDHLRRVLGLAQTLSNQFASKTIILYPNYDPIEHDNIESVAKTGFESKQYTESVTVGSYHDNFRGGNV